MQHKNPNLIWLDLEMTGLMPDTDKILEIATIITDSELNIIAEGPALAIYQGNTVINQMNKWCTKQHSASGLLARVATSKITESVAEAMTLEFLARHTTPQSSPLCGNSVWQDRRFLAAHMPRLEQYFHYRLIDVSTIKELAKRWAPDIYRKFTKQGAHLALADIQESIKELDYYRRNLLNIEKI